MIAANDNWSRAERVENALILIIGGGLSAAYWAALAYAFFG
jgi:hypothetical protein